MVPQSLLLQVAKRASVLKRRKSRNKMDPQSQPQDRTQDSEGDVVFYMEEPRATTPNR